MLNSFFNLFKSRKSPPPPDDINIRASAVHDYYQAYPYIVHYSTPQHALWYDEIERVRDWCNQHLDKRYRFDILRVYQDSDGVLRFNEIGGYDYLFFAFEDELDMIMFRLHWS